MPPAYVKKVAKRIGDGEVEKKWEKAKKVATKQYPKLSPKSDEWYAVVMGIYKKMTGLKKESRYLNVLNIFEHYRYFKH